LARVATVTREDYGVEGTLLCKDCSDCWSAILYSNKMKLHCFQLANNLNRILTFYYYFISMHTMARVQLDEGPQDVPQIALGLGLGMCTKGSTQLHI